MMDYSSSAACFSDDRVYRYALWRQWGDVEPLTFVLLNPSTADATQDDPTIRRCVGFAKAAGYGGIIVMNIFALRSTDPRALLDHEDPIGPRNDTTLLNLCAGRAVVAAWGTYGAYLDRGKKVETVLRASCDLNVLRLTKGGHPAHPLYLPSACGMTPWVV